MTALKFGHLARWKRPGPRSTSFYIDMRTDRSRTTRSSISACWPRGWTFVRGKVAEVTDAARIPWTKQGKLIVQVEDTLMGLQRRICPWTWSS